MTDLHSFEKWELQWKLGSGGFGEVFLWKNRETGLEIATKRLKENNQLGEDEIVKLKQRWQQEHKWMLDMKTKYIVRGINLNDPDFVAYLNNNHIWPTLPVIIMEFCNGGDIRTHLQKIENLNGLTEFEIREILQTLRHAVAYMHNVCGIEHRDLKPDNIIMHNDGHKRHYKLIDFGFARHTSDNTILKSCVGTRHYVAPEIVDTSKYTKTVDYWSMGIIAFELICGILPFLPHQGMYEIMVNIKKKKPECIAITENFDTKKFVPHMKLFEENRVSSVFKERIEQWLRIALDVNYKTRGTDPNATDEVLKIYTDIDEIAQLKILTVFCLNTYKFYSYEISEDMILGDLMSKMANDMGIISKNLFLFFPTGHPNSKLPSQSKPIELFVEKWQDTSNPLCPPVMLFAIDYEKGVDENDPYVSDIIKKCLSLSENVISSYPWLLEQFEQHTHFVLSNEHRLLQAYLTGLKDYALTLDDAIFKFSNSNILENLQANINETIGRVNQFHTMVMSVKNINSNTKDAMIDLWLRRINALSSELREMDAKIAQHIKKRYNSVFRLAKEEATKKTSNELIEADIYEIKTFRNHLRKVRNTSTRSDTRFKECCRSFYNCIKQRKKFFSNNLVLMSRQNITYVHKEFIKISNIVNDAYKFVENFNRRIIRETDQFFIELLENQQIVNNSIPLEVDCVSLATHSLVENAMSLSTQKLVEDTIENVNRIMDAFNCVETQASTQVD